MKNSIKLKGIPSSPGIVFGEAFVLSFEGGNFVSEQTTEFSIENEKSRIQKAVNKLVTEYSDILRKLDSENSSSYSVLESNLMIIDDPFLHNAIIERINKGVSAETALSAEFDLQRNFLLGSKDALIRDRAIDLEQIKQRFLFCLRDREMRIEYKSNTIFVSHSVTPTEIIKLHESSSIGLITEMGGISSHSSILARTFNIPSVIGVKDSTYLIADGDILILDGYAGEITVNPSKEEIENYKKWKEEEEKNKALLGEFINIKPITSDGIDIKSSVNINFIEDINSLKLLGSTSVGLVRTENLVITEQSIPEIDKQYNWYKSIAEQCYPNTVTFRVFDVGSDKLLYGMPKNESNPALGLRGIRYLLANKDIFKNQLIALLKASEYKNVRIMIPMISTLEELSESKKILEECKKTLTDENVLFDVKVPFGVMIETPSAAIISSALAFNCDFFSIGTNDLAQYTMAADRENDLLSNHFDSFQPAVLKLIKMTCDSAIKANIPVSVCGEMAANPYATQILIGLGVSELSVSTTYYAKLKRGITEIDFKKSSNLCKIILKLDSIDEIKAQIGIK